MRKTVAAIPIAAALLLVACSSAASSDEEVQQQIKDSGISLAKPWPDVKTMMQNTCGGTEGSLQFAAANMADENEANSIKLLRIGVKAYCPEKLGIVDKVLVDASYSG